MSYTYEGQLSTDKDDRKLGHMLGHMVLIPFPVVAGIKSIPAQTGNGFKINSSQNKKWNYENIHKLYILFVSL